MIDSDYFEIPDIHGHLRKYKKCTYCTYCTNHLSSEFVIFSSVLSIKNIRRRDSGPPSKNSE